MRTMTGYFRNILTIAILITAISVINAAAATFTVTNTNNSGAGSLRQAVLDANAAASADTIVFDASFNTPQMITLTSEIAVSQASSVDNLTITGPGANLLTINASGTIRIFTHGDTNVAATDTLSISGMTLTRSTTINANFAAVLNAGNLTATDVVFSSISGGVIDNRNNFSLSSLTVTNCVFNSNVGAFSAGAISNTGNLTATNSVFNSNVGNGGARSSTSAGSATVTGCTFTNNSNTAGGSSGGGGAIFNFGSGVMTVSDSTFTGNTTTAGDASGGAIRNRQGTVNVTNSMFSNNTTIRSGGAISSDVLNISGSTFTGNSTVGVNGTGNGGAINSDGVGLTTISNSVITGNSALLSGGGIYHAPGATTGTFLNITNSTVSNNIANSDSDTNGDGDGLFLDGTGSAAVSGSTINGNRANGGGTTSSGNGGGIQIGGNGIPTTLTNVTVSGNTAARNGGGIRALGVSTSIVTIESSTIVNNTAGFDGGGVNRGSTSNNPANFRNTIVANNTDGGTAPDIFGAVVSQDYNLIRNTTGATITGTTTNNITGQDPNLGPLQNNGGLTATHALLTGSPAIDKGASGTLTTDQRGFTRPVDNPANQRCGRRRRGHRRV